MEDLQVGWTSNKPAVFNRASTDPLNPDAIAQADELKPVQAYGITRISVQHDRYRAFYERQDRNELLKGRDVRELTIRSAERVR